MSTVWSKNSIEFMHLTICSTHTNISIVISMPILIAKPSGKSHAMVDWLEFLVFLSVLVIEPNVHK